MISASWTRSASEKPRTSASIPMWPKKAVQARVARLARRPVVWLGLGPTCAPITSGGKNTEKPRWMACRSSASLLSEVQMRSVRFRIS